MTEKEIIKKMTEEEKKMFAACRGLEIIAIELQELNEKALEELTKEQIHRKETLITNAQELAKGIGVEIFYQPDPSFGSLYFVNKDTKERLYLQY